MNWNKRISAVYDVRGRLVVFSDMIFQLVQDESDPPRWHCDALITSDKVLHASRSSAIRDRDGRILLLAGHPWEPLRCATSILTQAPYYSWDAVDIPQGGFPPDAHFAIALALRPDGRAVALNHFDDGRLAWALRDGAWGALTALPANLTAAARTVSLSFDAGGRMEIYRCGDDGQPYRSRQRSLSSFQDFEDWQPLATPPEALMQMVLATYPDRRKELFAVASDGSIYALDQVDGESWGTWRPVLTSHHFRALAVATAPQDGRIGIVACEDLGPLYLATQTEPGATTFSLPRKLEYVLYLGGTLAQSYERTCGPTAVLASNRALRSSRQGRAEAERALLAEICGDANLTETQKQGIAANDPAVINPITTNSTQLFDWLAGQYPDRSVVRVEHNPPDLRIFYRIKGAPSDQIETIELKFTEDRLQTLERIFKGALDLNRRRTTKAEIMAQILAQMVYHLHGAAGAGPFLGVPRHWMCVEHWQSGVGELYVVDPWSGKADVVPVVPGAGYACIPVKSWDSNAFTQELTSEAYYYDYYDNANNVLPGKDPTTVPEEQRWIYTKTRLRNVVTGVVGTGAMATEGIPILAVVFAWHVALDPVVPPAPEPSPTPEPTPAPEPSPAPEPPPPEPPIDESVPALDPPQEFFDKLGAVLSKNEKKVDPDAVLDLASWCNDSLVDRKKLPQYLGSAATDDEKLWTLGRMVVELARIEFLLGWMHTGGMEADNVSWEGKGKSGFEGTTNTGPFIDKYLEHFKMLEGKGNKKKGYDWCGMFLGYIYETQLGLNSPGETSIWNGAWGFAAVYPAGTGMRWNGDEFSPRPPRAGDIVVVRDPVNDYAHLGMVERFELADGKWRLRTIDGNVSLGFYDTQPKAGRTYPNCVSGRTYTMSLRNDDRHAGTWVNYVVRMELKYFAKTPYGGEFRELRNQLLGVLLGAARALVRKYNEVFPGAGLKEGDTVDRWTRKYREQQ